MLKLFKLSNKLSKLLTPSKTFTKVSKVLKTRFFFRVLRVRTKPHPSPTLSFCKTPPQNKIPLSAHRQGYHLYERLFKKSPQSYFNRTSTLTWLFSKCQPFSGCSGDTSTCGSFSVASLYPLPPVAYSSHA